MQPLLVMQPDVASMILGRLRSFGDNAAEKKWSKRAARIRRRCLHVSTTYELFHAGNTLVGKNGQHILPRITATIAASSHVTYY